MISKYFFYALILCQSPAIAQKIEVAGAMSNIMRRGDIGTYINIDTLSKENLYGLGPVAKLKGELLILNGKVYSTSRNGKQLNNLENGVSEATMLVYSRVKSWKPLSTQTNVNNYKELEELIKLTAAEYGFSGSEPFIFKLETTPGAVTFHVIDWDTRTVHTEDNHKQFAYNGTMKEEKVILVGFYSDHHQGIFTHHTSNMHVHVLNEANKTVGHLDDINIDGRMVIYLPIK